jgi:hypothetical protein
VSSKQSNTRGGKQSYTRAGKPSCDVSKAFMLSAHTHTHLPLYVNTQFQYNCTIYLPCKNSKITLFEFGVFSGKIKILCLPVYSINQSRRSTFTVLWKAKYTYTLKFPILIIPIVSTHKTVKKNCKLVLKLLRLNSRVT